jgi:hypothetical protein
MILILLLYKKMLTSNLILMTSDDFSMSVKLLIKFLLITQVIYQIRMNTKTLYMLPHMVFSAHQHNSSIANAACRRS